MKINSVNNYSTNFKGIKEAIEVWEDSKPTIKTALEATGNKNISILMHGNSFPSLINEDIGIGSPYTNGAKEVASFFDGVISKCVLGPWGVTNSTTKHSPYNSTLESLNPYFINFKHLTTSEGGNLISAESFENIVKNNPATINQVNYTYVDVSTKDLLNEAFDNYKNRLKNNDLFAVNLNKKIQNFQNKYNGIYLDAIFSILTEEYKDSNYNTWDEIDKKLPILLEQNNTKAKERLNEISKKHQDYIDKYLFTQYLAKEHTRFAPMKYVADKQVSIERNDAWKLQDIILSKIGKNDVCLGVPGDSFSPKGRCWGMLLIDVKKVFKKDGSLSNGGKRLFNIYKKIFNENKGGVRIDHFQGIIDPYICVNNSAELEDGAGRLLSSPQNRLFKSYSILKKENIDSSKKNYDYNYIKYLTKEQISEYAKFFEEIILAAAKQEGLDESNIMPEDLGAITKPTIEVMKKERLGSMKVTQFVNPENAEHMYRGINSKPGDFITTGTHDGKPLVNFFFDMDEKKYNKHLKMLTQDLNLKRPSTKKDRTYGIKLKFAELFIAPAKNVQIFFSHLLGLTDWYNKPGDRTVPKWSLRMPNNFKEVYLNNLAKGIAFNPYDALSRALKAKDKNKYKTLINQLKIFEKKLLKELR